MPVISESSYSPSFLFRFRHFNTIYPALFRSFPGLTYDRERISTSDGDFLDLDWSKIRSKKLLVVLHGLEGNADRPYIKGLIRHFNEKGWDGLAVNMRSCSGELNNNLRSYHMGVSDDLECVIDHILKYSEYSTIALAGFSMGGNIVLKYLGEQNGNLPDALKAAVALSVPCHIESANEKIEKWYNRLYVFRFMKTLNEKMRKKAKRFPGEINVDEPMPKNFTEFDERFTSKIHGFRNAVDYWRKCSSSQFFENIKIPTLLINAKDDSFLSEACFPFHIAEKNPYFYLETPNWGGHCGFAGDSTADGTLWSERRVYEFIELFQ